MFGTRAKLLEATVRGLIFLRYDSARHYIFTLSSISKYCFQNFTKSGID